MCRKTWSFHALTVLVLLILVPSIQAVHLKVDRTVINPITNFDLSYFDITGSGAGPTLFTITVVPGPTPDARYRIQYTVYCTTDVLSGKLFEAESGLFTIPSGGIVISSNEFFTNRGPSAPSLNRTIFSIDAGPLSDVITRSGIIPSGRITMRFELLDESGQNIHEVNTAMDIVAIRYVTLTAPGIESTQAQAGASIPALPTPYPLFLWNSDLLPVTYSSSVIKFELSLYENPEGMYAVSDIIDSKPVWSVRIDGATNNNYVQYPVSGTKALQPGTKYYWQVSAVLQGPVKKEIKSSLFVFTIADMHSSEILDPRQQQILMYLQMILGDNYNYVLSRLETLSPQRTVFLNGEKVSLEHLAQIARQFQRGQYTVKNIEWE